MFHYTTCASYIHHINLVLILRNLYPHIYTPWLKPLDFISSHLISSVDWQVGEVGELSEIFQWKGEVAKGLPDWEEAEKLHLGEELSDVLLYLIRLSDMCGIDLGKAALRKVELNALKYPAAAATNNQSTTTTDDDTAAA